MTLPWPTRMFGSHSTRPATSAWLLRRGRPFRAFPTPRIPMEHREDLATDSAALPETGMAAVFQGRFPQRWRGALPPMRRDCATTEVRFPTATRTRCPASRRNTFRTPGCLRFRQVSCGMSRCPVSGNSPRTPAACAAARSRSTTPCMKHDSWRSCLHIGQFRGCGCFHPAMDCGVRLRHNFPAGRRSHVPRWSRSCLLRGGRAVRCRRHVLCRVRPARHRLLPVSAF